MRVQPHVRVARGDIADTVLLPGDPERVDQIAAQCADAEALASHREYRVVNAAYEGELVTICSTGVGCPSAAIAVEELARAGAETFIRVGTTGALQREVEVGEMVVATAAAKNEGTTKRYEESEFPAVAHHEVVGALLDAAEGRDATVHVGAIATDDAYYAETPEYVTRWAAAGLLSVEMEAAAIFTLARRKGLRAGAICSVDGNLVEGTQKGAGGEDELPEETRATIERTIGIALDAAVSL